MAHHSSIASHRVNLDPQAAHCVGYEEALARYVDHYYVCEMTLTANHSIRLEQFIAAAAKTYETTLEFVSSVNMDLDVDWGDCLSVGQAAGAWAFDPASKLVFIAISPTAVHACDLLARRFLNPW